MASSVSDREDYLTICRQGSTQEGFESFRRRPEYTRVVETVWRSLGEVCLSHALQLRPDFVSYLDRFRKEDR